MRYFGRVAVYRAAGLEKLAAGEQALGGGGSSKKKKPAPRSMGTPPPGQAPAKPRSRQPSSGPAPLRGGIYDRIMEGGADGSKRTPASDSRGTPPPGQAPAKPRSRTYSDGPQPMRGGIYDRIMEGGADGSKRTPATDRMGTPPPGQAPAKPRSRTYSDGPQPMRGGIYDRIMQGGPDGSGGKQGPAPKPQAAEPKMMPKAMAALDRFTANNPRPQSGPAPKQAPAQKQAPQRPAPRQAPQGPDPRTELNALLGAMHQVDTRGTPLSRDVYRGIQGGRGQFSTGPQGGTQWRDGSLSFTQSPGGDWRMQRGRRPSNMDALSRL